MGRIVRFTILILIIALYAIYGAPSRLAGTDAPYLHRAALYSFFHANIWHLATNVLAVWTVFSPKRKGMGRELLLSYLIAVLVYPLSLRPVIGFSNILFATLGQRTPSLADKWWRTPPVILFLVLLFATLLLPQFSALTHIFSFALGMLIAACRRGVNNLLKDARRFIR